MTRISWFTVAVLLLAGAVAQAQYRIVSSTTTRNGEFRLTETVVQVGSNPVNRFVMHHVKRHGPACGQRGAVLLLPPLGPDYQFWEFSEDGDFRRSIAAYLADRGFEVFGYENRFRHIPAGACESGAMDCSVMADWGLGTLVQDATFIRGYMSVVRPGVLPVVGGHSAGSAAAMAVLNANPHDYLGAILWEGSLYSARPDVVALNQVWCSVDESMMSSGVVFDGSGAAFAALAHFDLTDPNSPVPFPVPGLPPGVTNHQAFIGFMPAPPPSPTTEPVPGGAFAVGDPIASTLTYADEVRLASSVATFVNYIPIAMARDVNCGLSGRRTFSANLWRFTGPILVIESGRGFDGTVLEGARLTHSSEITVEIQPQFGHSDAWANIDHRRYVERPIRRWLVSLYGR